MTLIKGTFEFEYIYQKPEPGNGISASVSIEGPPTITIYELGIEDRPVSVGTGTIKMLENETLIRCERVRMGQ